MADFKRIAVLAVGLLALATLRADDPPKPGENKASRKLDPAKLPPGAIIIVSDNPREAFQNVDAIVLSLDEFKKLLDSAEQARRAATPDRPDVPSVCKLTVRIESRGSRELAAIKAVYQFRTTVPRATVTLGLQNGKPRSATLDGQLAVLLPAKDDDGLVVQADSAGEHTLTIELEAPLTSRNTKPGERGFELGLPGAAITTLERVDLPEGAIRSRIGGRSIPVGQLTPTTSPALVLGSAPRLEVSWEGPAPVGQVAPLLSVDAKIDVRFEETAATTKSRLTVKVLRGASGQFTLDAPRDAEVTVDRATDSSLTIVPPGSGLESAQWIVRREASAVDLTINVVTKGSVAPARIASVFPPRIVEAAQQRGVVNVGSPPNLRLAFAVPPTSDLRRRESGDDAPRDATFSYSRLADAGSVLDVAVHVLRGQVESQIAHQLTLGPRGWKWHGKVEVRPVRNEVAQVDFEWPEELADPVVASSEFVESVNTVRDLGGGRRLVRISFAENRRRATTFELSGGFRSSATASPIDLPVPRVIGTVDRGGQITVATLPGRDVQASVREIDGGGTALPERSLEPGPRGSGTAAISTERGAALVRVAHRPVAHDVPVTATVDVRLADRQALVRCQWRLPLQALPPGSLNIRGPASLAGRIRGVDGTAIIATNAGNWTLQLPAGEPDRFATASISYSLPLPATLAGASMAIPLVWLDGFTSVETDVRIWPGTTRGGSIVPARVVGPWTEQPPQPAANVPTMPVMTLHGSGSDRELALVLDVVGPGPLHAMPVERLLMQVLIEEDGRQVYRLRALVRPFGVFEPELVLPEPAVACQFQALLDGHRLNWSASDPNGRAVRLRVELDAGKPTAVIDVSYTLARNPARPWVTALRPPQWRDTAGLPAARWQIGLPEGRTALALSSALDFADRWTWSRGLLMLQPEWTSAGLNRWIGGGLRPSEIESATNENALNAWAPPEQHLHFLIVPRSVLFLVSSLAVLGMGLVLSAARPAARTILAIALVAAAASIMIARPQLATTLAIGCQPGVVVLIVWLAVREHLRRRLDRRLIFLPRGAAAETSRSRLVREPSTVDAPASAS